MRISIVMAGAFMLLAVAAAASAQGRGKGPKSTPPSQTTLPPSAGTAAATPGTLPFAWIDDATTLKRGSVSVSLSTLFWHGADLNEIDAPIVGLAVGVADRLQLGA